MKIWKCKKKFKQRDLFLQDYCECLLLNEENAIVYKYWYESQESSKQPIKEREPRRQLIIRNPVFYNGEQDHSHEDFRN